MEVDELPTSPRKKRKAHHDSQLNMDEDLKATSSNAVPDQRSINAFGNDDRLDKEAQCGITEYVSPDLPGFRGVLKKRYTDFLVNEILPNGKVIHLENLKKPSDQQPLSQVASKASQHRNENSAQASPKRRGLSTSNENVSPQFESTNLNKVEHTTRKKETVFMQHGAGNLSLFEEQSKTGTESSEPGSIFTDKEKPIHDKALQPAEIDHDDTEEAAPAANGESGGGAPDKPRVSTNGAAENTRTSSSNGPSTPGGWQAYLTRTKTF